MSRLGSLYITSEEPEGPLCGGCCEVDDWASGEIERLRAELVNIRDANPRIWGAPYNDAEAFMEWAKGRARFALSPAPVPDNAKLPSA